MPDDESRCTAEITLETTGFMSRKTWTGQCFRPWGHELDGSDQHQALVHVKERHVMTFWRVDHDGNKVDIVT